MSILMGYRKVAATVVCAVFLIINLVGAIRMLAVAGPLQTQFEHKNLNIVLLALVASAVASFRSGRSVSGGIALGVATALKVYPICLLAWLAIRGRWRAFRAGLAVVIVLSLTPTLFRGVNGLAVDIADWQVLAGSGWPTRRANQSLVAMWGRYLLGEGARGYAYAWPEPVLRS